MDGGLPKHHPIGPWLRSYRKLDEDADDDPDGPEHGLGVTSAVLFGPIQPNGTAGRPFAPVDHLRVLDGRRAAKIHWSCIAHSVSSSRFCCRGPTSSST